jgi:flagellar biosynthesis/type III secretory pathway protein FliH
LLESLQESLQELHARRQQSLAELQELAVELAVAVAAHVTRGAIDRQEHGVEPLVREALDRLGASGPVRVSLHPLDLPRLQAAWQRPGDGPPAMVECVADPGTPRGTCRVTEGVRAVAFDWRTHLDDLRALLLEELEHAQTERRGSQAADQRIKRFPDRRETA